MSFTVGEAIEFHTLLRWLLPNFNHGSDSVTDDQALAALAYLADRANKAMLAGPDADDVRAAWPPPRLDLPDLPDADEPSGPPITTVTTTGDLL